MKNAAPRISRSASVAMKASACGMDFGDVAGDVVLLRRGVQRRPQRRRTILPGIAVRSGNDAALEPLAAVPVQQLHRHRVEHLVADDDALHRVGQRVQPAHLRTVEGEPLPLALAQAARQVDDASSCARARRARRATAARSAPEPAPNSHTVVAAARVQRLRHLRGKSLAEQRRQLGRGHEIAARGGHQPELAVVARVVAEAGRVQRQRHEAVERQPAAGLGDGTVDLPAKAQARGRRYTRRSSSFSATSPMRGL